MHSIKEVGVGGKTVLVRVDFNVPLKNGKVQDNNKIKQAIPTIKYLLKNKAKIVLMSHLGRPEGRDEGFSLLPVARELNKLLKLKVVFVNDCVNVEIPEAKIVLLENLRFRKEEEQNDEVFAQKLASLADIYVNNAFGASHRAHASIDSITKFIPSYSGFLLEKEISMLSEALNPEKPFNLILGGSKVSDKIGVVTNLAKKSENILVGGAMALTFLKAKNIEVGKSRIELDKLVLAKQLLIAYKNIILPGDFVLDSKKVVKKVPKNSSCFDIGPESVKLFCEKLKSSKTIVWNGPLGIFEKKPFNRSTENLAKFLKKLKSNVIICGGDTALAVKKFNFKNVSTGGGASLEFLEGKELPGIKALK